MPVSKSVEELINNLINAQEKHPKEDEELTELEEGCFAFINFMFRKDLHFRSCLMFVNATFSHLAAVDGNIGKFIFDLMVLCLKNGMEPEVISHLLEETYVI